MGDQSEVTHWHKMVRNTFVLFHFPFLLSSHPSPPVFTPELSDKVLFLLLILGGSWSPRGAPAVGVNQRLVAHTGFQPHVRILPGKRKLKESRGEKEVILASLAPVFVRNHQETLSTFRLSMSLSWRDKNTGAATSQRRLQQLLPYKPSKYKRGSRTRNV